MKKFRVEQVIQCEVRVWYTVETLSHDSALKKVAEVDCPTCADGADYEIISDGAVIYTKVLEDLDI
jgi:hypothetical protein